MFEQNMEKIRSISEHLVDISNLVIGRLFSVQLIEDLFRASEALVGLLSLAHRVIELAHFLEDSS